MLQVADLEELTRSIAAAVGPAVVGLGRGSGVVVAPGLVLSNAHVLRSEDVAVTVAGGRAVHGRVAGVDPGSDVAVIAADTGDTTPVAWEPERAEAAGIGTPVFALADPGARGLRVTFGLVCAAPRPVRGPRGRRIPGSLEHTAPLPKGSSGGPLVDADGHLLGLNTVRLEGGLILALPADAALRARVDALAHGRAAARPRMGVAVATLRGGEGLLVRAVQDASPAAVAGIARGDVVVGLEGRPLRSVDDLFDALERLGARQGALTLTVIRDAQEHDVALALLQ